jgi:hypothetical protein
VEIHGIVGDQHLLASFRQKNNTDHANSAVFERQLVNNGQ